MNKKRQMVPNLEFYFKRPCNTLQMLFVLIVFYECMSLLRPKVEAIFDLKELEEQTTLSMVSARHNFSKILCSA